MVKGGYVPYAFVTAMLPLAALLIAGTADAYWRPAGEISAEHRRGLSRVVASACATWARSRSSLAALVLVVICVPHWYGWLKQQSTVQRIRHRRRRGLLGRGPRAQERPGGVRRLSVAGHQAAHPATPLYLWQIDSDPQVMRTELPQGYRDISYLLLDPGSPLTFAALPGRPTLQQRSRTPRWSSGSAAS